MVDFTATDNALVWSNGDEHDSACFAQFLFQALWVDPLSVKQVGLCGPALAAPLSPVSGFNHGVETRNVIECGRANDEVFHVLNIRRLDRVAPKDEMGPAPNIDDVQKIILFYKFVPVGDTETVMFWQRALCEKLGLKGRVLISPHGINGTLGGDLQNLKFYTREMKAHSLFSGIDWKWSDGGTQEFPRLQVKARDEIVSFDASEELVVNERGVVGGGEHLSPQQLHELLEARGDDVVFYDGRNPFEAEIGRFKNAIVPEVEHSRDFKTDIESGEISKHKDRPIVTYCTGGIRCEVLTSLMKSRGYSEVYQLDGGIVRYGETFGDSGYWDGKLFVFDDRMQVSFSDQAKDIAKCYQCGTSTSRQVNSLGVHRKLYVCCEDCPTPLD